DTSALIAVLARLHRANARDIGQSAADRVPDRYVASTLNRLARLRLIPAQPQSTSAFARLSPPFSNARCTAPQASHAIWPFTVWPVGNSITATPRPIAAIVPLSM